MRAFSPGGVYIEQMFTAWPKPDVDDCRDCGYFFVARKMIDH
jgi:hypothetical protein